MNRRNVPLLASLVTFALHLAGNPHYGYFRDELYLIICGRHPQWGYVDQPPVTPLLAAGSQMFGHSLLLLRALPALFAAAAVYTTCLLAAELGGGNFAQILAAAVTFFAPVLMTFGVQVCPDMVGLWGWPYIALCAVRIAKGGDRRGWLVAGTVTGVCLQSKYSVVLFAAALLLGLLFTTQRQILFSRWLLAGCAVCSMIALPNFLWQAHYGFPMLELLRNGQQGKNLIVGPAQYMLQQLLITNVLLSIVWIIGLCWLLRNSLWRWLGYTYLILMGFMLAMHGKHYYPADVYPILIAAGATAIELWSSRRRALRPWLGTAVILAGLLFAPLAMPVLPEAQMASYMRWLFGAMRMSPQTVATERNRPSPIGQDWADMHGWPELASAVANVYQSLPPGDRAQAAIVASNYGEAAAIDFFGHRYGLPPAISGHNQYFLWGTHGSSGNVVIDVNGDCGSSRLLFDSSQRAATFSAPWVMPYEDGIPIMVCRGIRVPLADLWPKLKAYR